MPTAARTPLPLLPEGAYVVQLSAAPPQGPETLSGRIEHVASGRTAFFHSLDDLYRFLGTLDGRHGQPLSFG